MAVVFRDTGEFEGQFFLERFDGLDGGELRGDEFVRGVLRREDGDEGDEQFLPGREGIGKGLRAVGADDGEGVTHGLVV